MNETITRAAGATFGQEMTPEAMDALIASIGRVPVQRTTLYGLAPRERQTASYDADPLSEAVNTPAARYARDRDLRGHVQDKSRLRRRDSGLAAAQRTRFDQVDASQSSYAAWSARGAVLQFGSVLDFPGFCFMCFSTTLLTRLACGRARKVDVKEFPTVNFPHPKDQMEAACNHEPEIRTISRPRSTFPG